MWAALSLRNNTQVNQAKLVLRNSTNRAIAGVNPTAPEKSL